LIIKGNVYAKTRWIFLRLGQPVGEVYRKALQVSKGPGASRLVD